MMILGLNMFIYVFMILIHFKVFINIHEYANLYNSLLYIGPQKEWHVSKL